RESHASWRLIPDACERQGFPASDAESTLEMISVDVREHSRWRSPALQGIDPLVQETYIAGNAIDGAAPTLDDLVHEIWLAHEGARHRQEVGIARAQDFVHHL